MAWHEQLVEMVTDPDGRFVRAGLAVQAGDGPPAWRAIRGGNGYRVHFPERPPGPPLPWSLPWAQLDPAGHRFDAEAVQEVVHSLPAAVDVPARDADRRLHDLWLETVTRQLIDRYGTWVVGWRWSVGEGDLDAGVVGNWCCAGHSITTPEATRAAVAASVVEWHDWLIDLAERFARYLPLDGLPADAALDRWERAVANILTAVGDRTDYESGWYGCCEVALRWFLEAAGIEPGRRRELVEHAVGGRFKSWVEPPRREVQEVAERFAGRVVRGNR